MFVPYLKRLFPIVNPFFMCTGKMKVVLYEGLEFICVHMRMRKKSIIGDKLFKYVLKTINVIQATYLKPHNRFKTDRNPEQLRIKLWLNVL